MGAVYREELSANARKLIEQLLSLPQGWVTAAALAESIGVSRRTVLRELPAVEQWMQAAGAHFVRNPGKGLLLDEAPERRDALRTQLNSGDRKELSRAERRQQLLTRLLSEQEPCKTAVLARALGVSESTLSADLDELETKLHPYRVEMFRRPGVGVWLQGDASSYRRVVSALLRSSMPEKELQRCSADGCRKTRSSRPCWIQKRPKRSGRFCSSLNRKSSSICRMQAFWRWLSIAP